MEEKRFLYPEEIFSLSRLHNTTNGHHYSIYHSIPFYLTLALGFREKGLGSLIYPPVVGNIST